MELKCKGLTNVDIVNIANETENELTYWWCKMHVEEVIIIKYVNNIQVEKFALSFNEISVFIYLFIFCRKINLLLTVAYVYYIGNWE